MDDTAAFALATAALFAVAILVAWLRPDLVVSHPRTVLGAVAALSLAAALALVDLAPPGFRTRLDPSEEPMLRSGDPGLGVYREAVRNFGDDDVFVAAMEADGGVFTAESLHALRRASERVRRLPGVRATESLVDATVYRYVAASDVVEVDRFIDAIPADPAALADLRARALADRLYPRTIVSRDARTAAVNVSFRTMTDGEFVAARLDDRLRAILREESDPGRRFFVTGRQHIKARAHHLMVRDLLRLIPLAVAVGAAIAWLVTGSLRAAVIPVGASLVATLWAFGALAFLGRPLNLITIVLGPMLICVGSVYGVHVLARFDELAAGARSAPAAAFACLRYTLTPVLIAGLTTCVGFGALLLSDTPAVRELGVFAALGVASVSALSLTAVPALLAILAPPPAAVARQPRPASSAAMGPSTGPAPPAGGVARAAPPAVPRAALARALDALLAAVAAGATRHPLTVLAAWTALTVAALAAIPRIVVDTDYLSFFDADSDVRRDFAAVSERLVGAVPIYVVLSGEEEGTFREPKNLRALARLQALVDAVPGVSATLSVVDLIEVLNRAVERGDPAAERVPDTRGEVADVLFLIPKNRLRRFANANHSKVNLLVRTGESGSASIRALEDRLREAIAAADLPSGIAVDVTGNTIVLNRAADGIAGNQLGTVGAATAAILLIVTWAFRSLRLGLLAMAPNVVPVALFFGLLGAGAAALSLPTSLIGCIALGIAVDDTAHFLVGYRHRRAAGAAPAEAAADCVRRLGRPIVTTSLMLIGGFLVLSLSGFATLREFGYLAAATMLICLSADLLMLPAILARGRV